MLLATAGLAACTAGPMAEPSAEAPATTVVDAARLFDGERVVDRPRLVIRDGRILAAGTQDSLAIPEGARRVDLAGRHLMPGLIAAHSHVGMVSGTDFGGRFYTRETVARDLAQFQRYGVVAVNALGMNRPLFHELRREWRDGRHGGADLYGAGPGVGMADGGAPPPAMNPEPDQVARPRTPAEARAAVDAMADAGIDMVKVWIDDLNHQAPKLPPAVYRAAIDQAHARGLRAAAHIHDLVDAKGAVAAGVDVIGHGVRDRPVDAALLAAMRQRGVWYIPTVNLNEAEYIYAEHPEWLEQPFFRDAMSPALQARFRDPEWRRAALGRAEGQRQQVQTNIANLRAVRAAGVKVALGTDSGATPLRIPGVAEHLELAHFVAAGFSPVEALTAATRAGAEVMRLPDRGRLAPGYRADFIVLRADPTVDITNSRSIEAVWRNGAPAR
ncbi:amidohydrolase family protein [Roseomonas sp. 18066]|uniref:amidohydrolase family protein n=1 Tax=Roseomonas sp. 18066 TaxID=2681412 RepID=UPI00190F80F8|nr:amidohydrolase family protein [Roseomonas sp. 18066]